MCCITHIYLTSIHSLVTLTGHYMVVREGLTNPWIPDNWSWGGVASDHCPVVAEFYIDVSSKELSRPGVAVVDRGDIMPKHERWHCHSRKKKRVMGDLPTGSCLGPAAGCGVKSFLMNVRNCQVWSATFEFISVFYKQRAIKCSDCIYIYIYNDHNEEMCQTFSMCIYNKEELIVVQFVSAMFFMQACPVSDQDGWAILSPVLSVRRIMCQL